MKTFRLIHKRCSDRKEAEKSLVALKDKAKEPFVFQSNISRAWLVVLCEVDTEDEAWKAYTWFKEHQIEAFVQRII